MSIRDEFPIFKNKQKLQEPFIYLDSAATTQKPQIMIDSLVDFYANYNANIHRGVYHFAEAATQRYEEARAIVACSIGAYTDEIVWVKNATEGINLIAYSWALQQLKPEDEILLTEYEHHANLLPWQRVAEQTGAKLIFLSVMPNGTLDYSQITEKISKKTKLIACTAVSNVTGAYTDVKRISTCGRAVGAKILVDASQLLAHEQIDVTQWDIDFLVFSGHKVYGPTGIGVTYINRALQDSMVPYQLGGGMVFDVDWHTVRFATGPQKFEAGTPPIADAIALATAMQWLYSHDMVSIREREAALLSVVIDRLLAMPHVHIVGPVDELRLRGHLVSFWIDGMHAHDAAAFLGSYGIALRAGHHCVQPLAKKLIIDASLRVSLACYTTADDIAYFLQIMQTMKKL